MTLSLLFQRKRGRLAALLVPEPPIPSPNPLSPRLSLNHPLPEPFPDPALTELCRQPRLALAPWSGCKCAYDAFPDAETSRGEEEARDGHYRGEFVQDAEGEDEGWERCAGALGQRCEGLLVRGELGFWGGRW